MNAPLACPLSLALMIVTVANLGRVARAANPNELWYAQPAAKWEEALPVGNGRIGAMIFGDPFAERGNNPTSLRLRGARSEARQRRNVPMDRTVVQAEVDQNQAENP